MAKSTSRSIYLDQSAAEVALERLTKNVEKLEASIKKGNKAGKDMTAEIAKLNTAKKSVDELKNAIDKGLRPSFVQQEQLVRNLRNELRRMSEDAPGYAQKFQSFRTATAELNRMKTAIDGTAKAQASWMNNAKTVAFGVLIGNTVQADIQSITGYLSGLVSGNAKLSDQLADVEKASGLSATQVAKLNSELGKLDTRTSTANLREIAIGLGQLGQAVTAENVAAIDKIVVALGDEFGGGAKEITTVLSILRNNLQDIKTNDYGNDVARIGNALNVLGAEGLATAPIVTDFANRMAGVAGTFGLTSGQILGTAATFQELGINVERGSTAFVKILQKIAAEPAKFNAVAGLEIKEFTKLVNEDLLAAFLKVAEGAKSAGKDNVTFGKILKELDADGSGAGEVLSKVAQNAELLSEKVKLANGALTNTNSITEEFNKKNTNLAAEVEKLGKRISSAFANSAISNFLKDLVRGLNSAVTPAKNLTDQFREQRDRVDQLEKQIVPLVDRIDVLKNQSKLSKEEQLELNDAIITVGNTLPGAVTEFDKYGKAIGLSTEKAREFIEIQRAVLRERNRDAIKDTQKQIDDIQFQIKQNTNQAQGVVALGERQAKQFTKTREEYLKFIELYNKGAQELGQKNIALEDRLKGLQGILKELRGEPLVTPGPAAPPPAGTPPPPVIPFGDDKKDKKKDPRLDLLQQLRELQREVELLGKEGDEKELQRIVQKYQKLITEAKAYADIVIELEKLKNKEVAFLIEEITRKQAEEKKKQEQQEKEKTTKLREELMKRKEAELNVAREDGAKELDRRNRSELATVKINLINSPAGQARLRAQLELMEVERDQELQNVNLTEEQKELIRAEYRAKAAALEMEFYQAQVEQILSYTQQILSVVDQFYQLQSNRENERLQKEIKNNDVKRNAYKRLLDQRVISEAEYRRKIAALDEQEDKRRKELERKQFNRAKAAQIAQAIIGGALAVVSTLSARPGALDILSLGAFRAINIGIAIASTAAQIATIASTKPPEYAKGGIAKGGSHAEGGIDLYDRKSKRVVGNVEGGEPLLVLSKKTYANNADVIDELLDASMNRGGERINPGRIRRFWESRPYRSLNYSGASRALSKRYFETGGVIAPGNTVSNDSAPGADNSELMNNVMNVLLMVAETNASLRQELAKGIEANVSLKKFKDAETLDAQIRADGTMTP